MKKSTLIIGGGIAGLAAARELASKGVAVVLLEAKDRCGGRIHTMRRRDFPVELGAEFVHGSNPSLLQVLQEAQLPTLDVPGRTHLFANGKLTEVDPWETVAEVFEDHKMFPADCSCEKFLTETVAEPDRTMVRNFVEGFHAADAQRISAHALRNWQHAAEEMGESHSMWVATGYGSLVDYYEREITEFGGEILKNMTVRKIVWHNGQVEVWAEEVISGKPPTAPIEFLSDPPPTVRPEGGFHKFAAETAIITLPIAILKANEVQFEPPLPDKQKAAARMEVGNVVKITYAFKKPVWDRFDFLLAYDEVIPTWWEDPHGFSLTGWAGGPKADALVKLLPDQLEELGFETLCNIFSNKAAELKENFIGADYWNWADDPHIRGAYCYIPVGGLHLPRLLAAPVADTLFFAGEALATRAQTGTVFGALETGVRAAHEVLSVFHESEKMGKMAVAR